MEEHFKTIREALGSGPAYGKEGAAKEKAMAIAAVAILEQVVNDLHRIAASFDFDDGECGE